MTIPDDMDAVVFNGFGGPEVLEIGRKRVPDPASGEILIAVEAAGVNRPDVMQRLGAYPPPKGAPDWPGLEIAGTVVAKGEGAHRFHKGDRVMALLAGGGYAEYAAVAETNAIAVPDSMGTVEASAFPETFFTVWHNVFQRAGLKKGETFLVHGGTSGIGTTAIQLASAFGATAFATAGSDDKCRAAEGLGAARCVNYKTADFVETLKDATDGKGVDVILDMVGGEYSAQNLKLAAMEGRIVQIAFLKGPKVQIDLSKIMLKRLTFTGSTLRARTVDFKASVAEELTRHVLPLIEEGRVMPLIDTTYRLADAADAHRHMDENHIGKIVLTTDHLKTR